MLYTQLYGAHNLRCLYLLVGNLAAFANPAMTNLALLVRLVVGRAQRTIAQLGVRTKAYTTSMCYNKYHYTIYRQSVLTSGDELPTWSVVEATSSQGVLLLVNYLVSSRLLNNLDHMHSE